MTNEMPKMPLNEDEAHEVANMMRVKLGENPDEKFSKPLTAPEYDAVLAAVEEIKQLAEAETVTQKVLNKIARIAVETGFAALKPFAAMAAGPGPVAAEIEKGSEAKKMEILKRCEDASTKLSKLRVEAEKFEK